MGCPIVFLDFASLTSNRTIDSGLLLQSAGHLYVECPLPSVPSGHYGSQAAADTFYSLIQRGKPTIEWFNATAISSA
jgi:hypothetical protein